ncbi:hypothetical protein M0638_07090 [Roseomonas sp. NAR14]|uniref:Uncharacterized protein n=1 Tax=Roseomonas acroporae TaxID=2937791 RepID=A0A9X2BWQ7_9PROT|nr:hypothetical protein [Roseomonas acroporae]MCK8784140.1 hypothetical protein [Roseomonas acroporae]
MRLIPAAWRRLRLAAAMLACDAATLRAAEGVVSRRGRTRREEVAELLALPIARSLGTPPGLHLALSDGRTAFLAVPRPAGGATLLLLWRARRSGPHWRHVDLDAAGAIRLRQFLSDGEHGR